MKWNEYLERFRELSQLYSIKLSDLGQEMQKAVRLTLKENGWTLSDLEEISLVFNPRGTEAAPIEMYLHKGFSSDDPLLQVAVKYPRKYFRNIDISRLMPC